MFLKTMYSSNDKRIAQIKLSIHDLKRMVVDEILKDEAARQALEGKNIRVEIDWHVFKWDDPINIATFTLVEEDR